MLHGALDHAHAVVGGRRPGGFSVSRHLAQGRYRERRRRDDRRGRDWRFCHGGIGAIRVARSQTRQQRAFDGTRRRPLGQWRRRFDRGRFARAQARQQRALVCPGGRRLAQIFHAHLGDA